MDLTTLRYFLEIAREENMSRAAHRLHVSQSALSKRIKVLEAELGTDLFLRHSFSIELTDEGRLLAERAAELVQLHDKIEADFRTWKEPLGGRLAFGMAEAQSVRHIAKAIRRLRAKAPKLHTAIASGDTALVTQQLDKGLLDFGLIVEEPNREKYHAIALPDPDRWVVVLPADSPLSRKPEVTYGDLRKVAIFCSEQGWRGDIHEWCGGHEDVLPLESHVTLPNNGTYFVREGLGVLLTFDGLVDTSPGSGLAARPLSPALFGKSYLIWRKGGSVSPIAEHFLETLRQYLAEPSDETRKTVEASRDEKAPEAETQRLPHADATLTNTGDRP